MMTILTSLIVVIDLDRLVSVHIYCCSTTENAIEP